MRLHFTRRASFLLGFSAAIGILLAVSIVALGNTAGSSAGADPPAPADVTTLLSSFSRDRAGSDALTPEAQKALADLSATPAPSENLDPGSLRLSNSRKVLSNAGSAGAEMFLVPTSKHQVCLLVTPFGGAGCMNGVRLAADGVDWALSDADGLGKGAPTVIYGVVASGVARLESVDGGKATNLALTDGAFYAELANMPDLLRLTLSDGTSREVAIPALPTK